MVSQTLYRMKLFAAVGIIGLVKFSLANVLGSRDISFNWTMLSPSTNLSWEPCYSTFRCARLTVPLQYSDPTGDQAQIALIMSPSDFSIGDASYLGPVLFNPGGPGASGVDYFLQYYSLYRETLGLQFDLVGFDPRGTGATTPSLTMFKDSVEAGQLISAYAYNANESYSTIGRNFALVEVLDTFANDRAKKVAESVGTPTVARDMMSIVKALGQDKLQYWGFSYGTTIGATFAAMFPDNIQRVLFDGVLNSHDYYAANYVPHLVDSEQVLTNIFDACVAAGPSACAIYENSTELIRARVSNILDAVHQAPISFVNDTDFSNINFATVDYSAVTVALSQALTVPYMLAPVFAETIVGLEQGNASGFLAAFPPITANLFTCNSGSPTPFSLGGLDVLTAIQCGDRLVLEPTNLQASRPIFDEMIATSPSFGPVLFAQTAGPCSAWSIRSNDRFNASFIQNTSFPIMLIGNTADPITPIDGAYNMSSGFAGSVVLQQNSSGHTSLSGFNNCTAAAVRAYFVNGTLPTEGAVCQPGFDIFSPTSLAVERRQESPWLSKAIRGLRALKLMDHGLLTMNLGL